MPVLQSDPHLLFLFDSFLYSQFSPFHCTSLSSHDNRKLFPALISRQITFPKNPYRWQLITPPTLVSHRQSVLTGNLRKYHYQKYVSSPRATAAHFARHSSLLTLTSISEINISSYALPYNESRYLMACPHSGSTYFTRPVCICL